MNRTGNADSLRFIPAGTGEIAEIMPGVIQPVAGYFTASDGRKAIPCIPTMSDYNYLLLSLIDRLFHPDNYIRILKENVQESVDSLICSISERCVPEKKDDVMQELKELVQYVDELADKEKDATEQYIKAYFRACRQQRQ